MRPQLREQRGWHPEVECCDSAVSVLPEHFAADCAGCTCGRRRSGGGGLQKDNALTTRGAAGLRRGLSQQIDRLRLTGGQIEKTACRPRQLAWSGGGHQHERLVTRLLTTLFGVRGGPSLGVRPGEAKRLRRSGKQQRFCIALGADAPRGRRLAMRTSRLGRKRWGGWGQGPHHVKRTVVT